MASVLVQWFFGQKYGLRDRKTRAGLGKVKPGIMLKLTTRLTALKPKTETGMIGKTGLTSVSDPIVREESLATPTLDRNYATKVSLWSNASKTLGPLYN